ncbi:MAG: adenylate/guanylate cyclase domain-containing protein [Saprospiraceae bacterium]|nr:adenylate/guanylate cyclase domain-containing protein [Saprospiraceae bacterium]
MVSPKTKRNISRILPFGIIWLVSGWVFLAIEAAAIESPEYLPSTAINMDFKIFIFASLAITAVGLLVGIIELVYLDRAFAKKSFAQKMFYKIIIYALLLSLVILITFPIAASFELNTTVFDARVWEKYIQYLTSRTNVSTMLQMTVSLGLSLFYAEISENIGHGVLINFFTGKYHNPIEEKRIFMFLDMKSSTTIAEKLGHIRYFELLKEYYADISDAVIQYSGEIYQYVGDEMVVSWKYKDGVANNNCIKCFFAMKKDLGKRSNWYNKKFGLQPSFKAGLHCGDVTTGEIGVIKKDIIFAGDVLNATARIQALCNTYHVEILISADLIKDLNLSSEFQIKSLGQNELRGKEEDLELFTIL